MTPPLNGRCPDCGHSVLNHKRGGCIVAVTVVKRTDRESYPHAHHCGCTSFGPLDHPQLSLDLPQ